MSMIGTLYGDYDAFCGEEILIIGSVVKNGRFRKKVSVCFCVCFCV
jgi:hypothetical protein